MAIPQTQEEFRAYKIKYLEDQALNQQVYHQRIMQQVPCDRCGSPDHSLAKCPIPSDTSPEKERSRAVQGGCCGSPI